jgi:hypothetical protein
MIETSELLSISRIWGPHRVGTLERRLKDMELLRLDAFFETSADTYILNYRGILPHWWSSKMVGFRIIRISIYQGASIFGYK